MTRICEALDILLPLKFKHATATLLPLSMCSFLALRVIHTLSLLFAQVTAAIAKFPCRDVRMYSGAPMTAVSTVDVAGPRGDGYAATTTTTQRARARKPKAKRDLIETRRPT